MSIHTLRRKKPILSPFRMTSSVFFTWNIGNVERSKQIQHDKIEPIRSSNRRGLSFDVILHFFVGGSSILMQSDIASAIPVDDIDVSGASDGRLTISVCIFVCNSL